MKQLLAALRSGNPPPQQVLIPAELDQAFCALWQRSSIPPYHEWGASIVETEGGELTIGVEVEGDKKGIRFPPEVLAQAGFVGTFHTHPPEADGTTGVPFSEGDIANAINFRQEIAVVQSGEMRFLLAQRLSAWQGHVAVSDVERQLFEFWADYIENYHLHPTEALRQANIRLCRLYGLEFYQGSGSALAPPEGGG